MRRIWVLFGAIGLAVAGLDGMVRAEANARKTGDSGTTTVRSDQNVAPRVQPAARVQSAPRVQSSQRSMPMKSNVSVRSTSGTSSRSRPIGQATAKAKSNSEPRGEGVQRPTPTPRKNVNYMQQKADAVRAARNRPPTPAPPPSTTQESKSTVKDVTRRDWDHHPHHDHPDYRRDAGSPYRHGSSPYGYSPYGYSPYGYDPYYGSGYSPYGVTGYVIAVTPYGYPAYGYGYGFPYGYSPGAIALSPYYDHWPRAYRNYEYPWYARTLFSPFPGALFMPAEQLYGVGPIQRLMGVDHWFNQPAAPAIAAQAPAPVDRAAADDDKPIPRDLTGKSTALAWRYISFGDAHFGNQKYSDAYERYRKATQQSPKVADAWFRQGFALAAMGQYERAAKAMRRGLEFKPDWASAEFTLDDIYRSDAVAKKARMDAMLKASDDDPNNGDLSFLLGVHFYFDGQRDRAAPLFRRAAEVAGSDADVKAFLK